MDESATSVFLDARVFEAVILKTRNAAMMNITAPSPSKTIWGNTE